MMNLVVETCPSAYHDMWYSTVVIEQGDTCVWLGFSVAPTRQRAEKKAISMAGSNVEKLIAALDRLKIDLSQKDVAFRADIHEQLDGYLFMQRTNAGALEALLIDKNSNAYLCIAYMVGVTQKLFVGEVRRQLTLILAEIKKH